jgi:hypothetical protein
MELPNIDNVYLVLQLPPKITLPLQYYTLQLKCLENFASQP